MGLLLVLPVLHIRQPRPSLQGTPPPPPPLPPSPPVPSTPPAPPTVLPPKRTPTPTQPGKRKWKGAHTMEPLSAALLDEAWSDESISQVDGAMDTPLERPIHLA